MNGKRLILTAAFFSACTLFADILLEVRPGEIIKDRWQKDRGTFTTGSHPKNVIAGKEKQIGFARYCSDSNTYYKLKDMKNCGTSNFTITALLRFSGKEGQCFVMGAGGWSHVSPGYRLGIAANRGKVSAYAMFVAASTKETAKKFVTVSMDPKIVLEPGKWVVLTLSANRSGNLQLFVNGELAGSKSMKAYEKENLFPKPILFATYCPKAPKGADSPLQTEIAEIVVRNELLSSSQIQNEAEEMLDEAES